MYQLSFSLEDFLSQYWQKKPVIIKGGFKQFQDPITADELAGLTMEEEVDSRFVSNLNDEWVAEHGPFGEEKFATLGESNWSLIVQAANHWHPQAAQLVDAFKSLPQWLFDDLMISYSVEGGGVGPHIDQYDVFITQGSGNRHWRVGAKDEGQYEETVRHSALRQIDSFEPIIDDILEPGDILYIPPGFPHDGYALEPSLSYSIGFRSPKQQELISNYADYILAHDIGDVHLHKPELKTQKNFGEITTSDLQSLTQMLKDSLNNEARINDFMGCMLSQSRHQLNIIAPEPEWTAEDIAYQLQNGNSLYKVAGLRALYHEQSQNQIYINGEVFAVSPEQATLVAVLCGEDVLNLQNVDNATELDSLTLICELVNKGYWYLDEE